MISGDVPGSAMRGVQFALGGRCGRTVSTPDKPNNVGPQWEGPLAIYAVDSPVGDELL
jgi:hypothetical protein